MLKELAIAAVQGLTEFLPVSSSAHIALLEHLFRLFQQNLLREVVLHAATLLAVLVFFRKRIVELVKSWLQGKQLTYLGALFLGSLPAALFGLLFLDVVERTFASVRAIALFMLVNGAVLLLSAFARSRGEQISLKKAFLIGLAQALALFPGISRSGSTITAGLFLGLSPEEAFDFSFLLSIPAVSGAFLLEVLKVGSLNLRTMALPFAVAFASGLAALWLLRKIVLKGRFYLFAPYVVLIAIIALLFGG